MQNLTICMRLHNKIDGNLITLLHCFLVLEKLGNQTPLYNAWKIYNMAKAKWITVHASSPEERNLWIEALTSVNSKRSIAG